MSLSAGTKLGRYEIRSKIGEGGMGEVYLAHDAELKRTVALKFLPAEVASDHKRLERFEREALAASALNHPNILTVYDIGKTDDGRRFFVTEFVEGATLREHVKARRPKLGEVLDMAAQIAGAIVEAHAHGIVHRDIKPENVMVRRDGYVKVLDFGLAKLTGGPSSGVDPEAATQALVVTDAGAVMGTVSYMSPEQSQGLEVDARTDVWSLGVVLYEMLTGRLPFGGKSASHTIVAIQDDEPPPLAAHMTEAPELLQEVVSDALAKDRDARLTAKQMLAKLQRLKRRLDLGGTLDSSFVPNVSTASGEVSRGATASQPGVATGGAQATALAAANTAGGGTAQTVSSVEFVATKIRAHKRGFIIALVVAIVLVCAQDAPGPDATVKAFVVPTAGGDPVHTIEWPKGADALWLSPDSQALDYIATRDGIPNLWRLHLASGREHGLPTGRRPRRSGRSPGHATESNWPSRATRRPTTSS